MAKRTARIELRPVEGSTTTHDPHYLRLVAANGQVLATSAATTVTASERQQVNFTIEAG